MVHNFKFSETELAIVAVLPLVALTSLCDCGPRFVVIVAWYFLFVTTVVYSLLFSRHTPDFDPVGKIPENINDCEAYDCFKSALMDVRNSY